MAAAIGVVAVVTILVGLLGLLVWAVLQDDAEMEYLRQARLQREADTHKRNQQARARR